VSREAATPRLGADSIRVPSVKDSHRMRTGQQHHQKHHRRRLVLPLLAGPALVTTTLLLTSAPAWAYEASGTDTCSVPGASGYVKLDVYWNISTSGASVQVENPTHVRNNTSRWVYAQVRFIDADGAHNATVEGIPAGTAETVSVDNPWGRRPAKVQAKVWTIGNEASPGWCIVPM
jgi:hypothetical protein